MPTERTCEHCGKPVGVYGKAYGETDTGEPRYYCNDECMLADWQPHEDLTHGSSSPAGDWREPMVDAGNGSTPPEAHVGRHLRSGLTHGRLDAMTGQIICPACGGSGWQNNWGTTAGTVCTTCNGSGVVDAEPPAQDTLTIMAERDLLREKVAELEDIVASLQSRMARFAARIDRRMVAYARRRQCER